MFSTWRPGATPMSQYGLRDERDGDGGQVSEDGGPHRSQKRPQSTSLFPSLDGAASPMPGSMKRLRLSWEQSTSCSAFDAATGFQSQSIEALRGVVEEPSASQAGRGGARFDRETRTAVIEERLYQARTMDACRKSLNNLAETLSRGFQATESSLVVREEGMLVEDTYGCTTLSIPGVSQFELQASVERAREGIADLRQERCHKQLPEPAGVRAPSPFSELFGGWPVLPEAGAVATQTDASHEEEEKEFEEPGADEHEEGLEVFLGRVDKSKRRSSGSPVRRVEQLVEEPEYDEVYEGRGEEEEEEEDDGEEDEGDEDEDEDEVVVLDSSSDEEKEAKAGQSEDDDEEDDARDALKVPMKRRQLLEGHGRPPADYWAQFGRGKRKLGTARRADIEEDGSADEGPEAATGYGKPSASRRPTGHDYGKYEDDEDDEDDEDYEGEEEEEANEEDEDEYDEEEDEEEEEQLMEVQEDEEEEEEDDEGADENVADAQEGVESDGGEAGGRLPLKARRMLSNRREHEEEGRSRRQREVHGVQDVDEEDEEEGAREDEEEEEEDDQVGLDDDDDDEEEEEARRFLKRRVLGGSRGSRFKQLPLVKGVDGDEEEAASGEDAEGEQREAREEDEEEDGIVQGQRHNIRRARGEEDEEEEDEEEDDEDDEDAARMGKMMANRSRTIEVSRKAAQGVRQPVSVARQAGGLGAAEEEDEEGDRAPGVGGEDTDEDEGLIALREARQVLGEGRGPTSRFSSRYEEAPLAEAGGHASDEEDGQEARGGRGQHGHDRASEDTEEDDEEQQRVQRDVDKAGEDQGEDEEQQLPEGENDDLEEGSAETNPVEDRPADTAPGADLYDDLDKEEEEEGAGGKEGEEEDEESTLPEEQEKAVGRGSDTAKDSDEEGGEDEDEDGAERERTKVAQGGDSDAEQGEEAEGDDKETTATGAAKLSGDIHTKSTDHVEDLEAEATAATGADSNEGGDKSEEAKEGEQQQQSQVVFDEVQVDEDDKKEGAEADEDDATAGGASAGRADDEMDEAVDAMSNGEDSTVMDQVPVADEEEGGSDRMEAECAADEDDEEETMRGSPEATGMDTED